MDILNNYNKIIYNYTLFFNNNITNSKNKNKLYIKGLNILFNIFTLGYNIYENNEIVNLCEKGYIYFIEFINQLNLSTLSGNVFDLTLKDVILFTYKKTIFNNNITIRENFEHKILIFLYILDKLYISFYSNLLTNNLDTLYINNFFNIINNYIKTLYQYDITILEKINDYLNDNNDINIIYKYLDNVKN